MTTLPAELPPALGAQIASELVRFSSPVLSRADAITITGCKSSAAFDRWLREHKVKPCSHGRYPRFQIWRALETEAGLRGIGCRKKKRKPTGEPQ